ncbi:MAG: hypothetical protein V3W41_00105 [Planctomycetota bacterium]
MIRIALAGLLLLTFGFCSATKAQGPPQRTVYESKCGSEIAWLTDFEAAKAAALKSKKPVFWYVPASYGSRMDRRQELYWSTMGGAFMDEALIALINQRFVPLRLGLSKVMRRNRNETIPPREQCKALAETYGLKHLKFIEPGFVLLDADMKLVHTMDAQSTYNRGWMMARLKRVMATNPSMGGPLQGPLLPARGKELKTAHDHLAAAEYLSAFAAFNGKALSKNPEARFFAGACYHRLQRTSEGDAIWRKLVQDHKDSRWAWKAKLELDRWGPFMRGLESYRQFSPRAMASDNLRTSTIGGDQSNQEEMVKGAVNVLLEQQREDGSWNDSIYDFGGLDSLPNVHVAVTAIAARALLEWRAVAPLRVDAAIKRAMPYLLSEKNTNPADKDELIWAHVYRLHFFGRYAELHEEQAKKIGRKIQQITKLVLKLRARNGAWRHEYNAAFTTASVICALKQVQNSGAKVKPSVFKLTGVSLAETRSENGGFSYGYSKRGAKRIEGTAGRMPLCELALVLCEQSDQERLAKAIEVGFAEHARLEAVRKYDDHSDRFGNGGFFYWYDMYGRSLAIDHIEGAPDKKRAWKKKMREIIRSTHEADGAWIDSHEIGKSYGTAMGLITLKINEDKTQ